MTVATGNRVSRNTHAPLSRPGTLSAEGKEQALEAAKVIKKMDLHPEIIITSDLARAADYAAIIGQELNLKIELDPLARERGAGEAEGKSQSEIDWKEYEKAPKLLRKHAGGESFEDVGNRAKDFLKKMKTLKRIQARRLPQKHLF